MQHIKKATKHNKNGKESERERRIGGGREKRTEGGRREEEKEGEKKRKIKKRTIHGVSFVSF
jgi:hypothetical protein